MNPAVTGIETLVKLHHYLGLEFNVKLIHFNFFFKIIIKLVSMCLKIAFIKYSFKKLMLKSYSLTTTLRLILTTYSFFKNTIGKYVLKVNF